MSLDFSAQKFSSTAWILADFELEHARKVLKIALGDAVEVMDGKGHVVSGRVEESSRERILVSIERENTESCQKVRKCLAIGALKPGDLDDLLPALTELGADEIHVFQQQDTAKFRTSDNAKNRWQRIVVSAVKQCKRTWLPEVVVHENLANALLALKDCQVKLVFDVTGSESLGAGLTCAATSVACIVGGERGLTSVELRACQDAGFGVAKHGEHILRAKTAAIAAASYMCLIKPV